MNLMFLYFGLARLNTSNRRAKSGSWKSQFLKTLSSNDEYNCINVCQWQIKVKSNLFQRKQSNYGENCLAPQVPCTVYYNCKYISSYVFAFGLLKEQYFLRQQRFFLETAAYFIFQLFISEQFCCQLVHVARSHFRLSSFYAFAYVYLPPVCYSFIFC